MDAVYKKSRIWSFVCPKSWNLVTCSPLARPHFYYTRDILNVPFFQFSKSDGDSPSECGDAVEQKTFFEIKLKAHFRVIYLQLNSWNLFWQFSRIKFQDFSFKVIKGQIKSISSPRSSWKWLHSKIKFEITFWPTQKWFHKHYNKWESDWLKVTCGWRHSVKSF